MNILIVRSCCSTFLNKRRSMNNFGRFGNCFLTNYFSLKPKPMNNTIRIVVNVRGYICLCVCMLFSSNTRLVHSYPNVPIAAEGLHIRHILIVYYCWH